MTIGTYGPRWLAHGYDLNVAVALRQTTTRPILYAEVAAADGNLTLPVNSGDNVHNTQRATVNTRAYSTPTKE